MKLLDVIYKGPIAWVARHGLLPNFIEVAL